MPVTLPQLAKIFGVSSQRVGQLLRDGTVTRPLVIGASVQSLVKHTREAARKQITPSPTLAKVTAGRAREYDLRNAEREGRLVDLTEAIDTWSEAAGFLRAGLAGVGASVTRDPIMQQKIERAINDILEQATTRLEQAENLAPNAWATPAAVEGNDTERVGRR